MEKGPGIYASVHVCAYGVVIVAYEIFILPCSYSVQSDQFSETFGYGDVLIIIIAVIITLTISVIIIC